MDPFEMMPSPTSNRPLLGLTILAVEDSLFASEALRLLCLRSGARIRRADCLASARRHLQVYRPQVVVIDLGLPDGSGVELIAELANGHPPVGVIAGISGDPGMGPVAMAAGAQCFLQKPLKGLAAFQEAILEHLPPERRPIGPRAMSMEEIEPDLLAYHDDIAHAAELLGDAVQTGSLDYLTQFLRGVGHCAGDAALVDAVEGLRAVRGSGLPESGQVKRLSAMLQQRLSERMVI